MATTLAEQTALGGQAGTSSRIENVLGFPSGLSGEELAARAAHVDAITPVVPQFGIEPEKAALYRARIAELFYG